MVTGVFIASFASSAMSVSRARPKVTRSRAGVRGSLGRDRRRHARVPALELSCARWRARAHLRDASSRDVARARAQSTIVDAASDGGGDGVRWMRVARDSPAVEPSRLDAYVAANVDDASASRARVAAAIKAGW